MNILIWFFIVLLVLKIIWNFAVPYRLLYRMYHYDDRRPKQGISLSLGIEFILLLIVLVFSWLSEGDSFINNPLSLLLFGGGAILISYLHFYVAGMVGGTIVSIIKRTKEKNNVSSSEDIT